MRLQTTRYASFRQDEHLNRVRLEKWQMIVLSCALALFTSSASAAPAPQAKPSESASTTAVKEGVGLKLTLLSQRIKLGQPLSIKVQLSNRSERTMSVADWVYCGSDDITREWAQNTLYSHGTSVEVQSSTGVKYQLQEHFSGDQGRLGNDRRGQHLDDHVSPQLNEGSDQRSPEKDEELREAKYPVIKLPPGQAATSIGLCELDSLNLSPSRQCRNDGFVELGFGIDKPGIYRARIVYDERIPEGLRRRYLREGTVPKQNEWEVRVATPWISFEVYE